MFRFNNMLILKVTKDCNLRCEYCYVKNKDDYKGQLIDFGVYKKIIDKVIKDKLSQDKSDIAIEIVFHGGEPLLLPNNLFMKMLEYGHNKFTQNNIKYSFNMQSNLTLLTEEKAQLISRYNISMGVSFDGIKDGNVKRTEDHDQKDFENKFDLMDKYNIDYGFLIVVGDHNLYDVVETTNYLRDTYNQDNFKVNYVEDIVGIGGEVEGDAFFENAWKPFIDEFIQTGVCREGNSDLLIRKWMYYKLTLQEQIQKTNCGSRICGAGMNIIEVEPDGRVFYCGRYSEPYEDAYVQHAFDYDFLALHQLKRFFDNALIKHDLIVQSECDTCFARNICDHGCMAFHYSKFGEFGIRKDLVCDIYKSVWKYLNANAVELFRALTLNGLPESIFELDRTGVTINMHDPVFRELDRKYNIKVQMDDNDPYKVLIRDVSKSIGE